MIGEALPHIGRERVFIANKAVCRGGETEAQVLDRVRRSLERLRTDYVDAYPMHHTPTGTACGRRISFALAASKWVLQNPDAHTVCVSLNDFDNIDRVVSLSGTRLSQSDERLLDGLARSVDARYCRHGCVACARECPKEVPVSRIMRYAYYFEGQGRERHAMSRYAHLGGSDGSACVDCSAPCESACPHGFRIQREMSRAHPLLTLA